MQHLVDIISPVITLLLLVAVGLELTVGDFRQVRNRSGMVIAGVLLPPLVLPSLGVVLIRALEPSPAIAAGLLLLVACPIGGLSNSYSMLARASTALSVTLTAVSLAAAIATIPAAVALLERVWQQPVPYSAPVMMLVRQLFVVLAPPVAAGMLMRALWPSLATRYRRVVATVAYALLAALLALVIATGPVRPDTQWKSAVELAVAFVAAACLVGAIVAWLLGGSPADRFTFAAEFSTRNVAVALAIAMSFGTYHDFVWFGAIYLAVEIPLLTTAAVAYRRLAEGRTTSE